MISGKMMEKQGKLPHGRSKILLEQDLLVDKNLHSWKKLLYFNEQ